MTAAEAKAFVKWCAELKPGYGDAKYQVDAVRAAALALMEK